HYTSGYVYQLKSFFILAFVFLTDFTFCNKTMQTYVHCFKCNLCGLTVSITYFCGSPDHKLMNDIVTVLEQQNYYSIPFRIRKSNHLYVHAKINRIKGLFLIDTGASNTCIDSNEKSFFNLLSKAH